MNGIEISIYNKYQKINEVIDKTVDDTYYNN